MFGSIVETLDVCNGTTRVRRLPLHSLAARPLPIRRSRQVSHEMMLGHISSQVERIRCRLWGHSQMPDRGNPHSSIHRRISRIDRVVTGKMPSELVRVDLGEADSGCAPVRF